MAAGLTTLECAFTERSQGALQQVPGFLLSDLMLGDGCLLLFYLMRCRDSCMTSYASKAKQLAATWQDGVLTINAVTCINLDAVKILPELTTFLASTLSG